MAFKMKGMSFGSEGPVKPKNMMEAKNKETWTHGTIIPGYEEPAKIMKVERKGVTPNSQNFMKKSAIRNYKKGYYGA
tara:strand:+ start:544 stop:774 length:231 start_codon:yes stop_codon:yes gene_type:complete